MTSEPILYSTLPDGTLKHIHPITGTEVWTVPTRAHRPFVNRQVLPPKAIPTVSPENFCDFCEAHYLRTPPEKARLVRTSDGTYRKMENLAAKDLPASSALFRRMANLFEIIGFDYWAKNHGLSLSTSQAGWKKAYLDDPQGRAHARALLGSKLKLFGRTESDVEAILSDVSSPFYDSFFGGTHEVISAGRHFRPGASLDDELFSAGEMTSEEHAAYIRFTIDAMVDIQANNRHVRYCSVFQNWLRAAGASFDHLHKQIVGLDDWGEALRSRLEHAQRDPAVFNRSIVDFSYEKGLVVAENDQAVALSEMGHPYPTLAIYSKSRASRPQDHTEAELRGFSDLVHACHAAAGSQVPCNEVWFYTPHDSKVAIPWHVLIQWRTVTLAGFETGTRIFINPVAPATLKEQTASRLLGLRAQGRIQGLRIDTECRRTPAPLQYGKG